MFLVKKTANYVIQNSTFYKRQNSLVKTFADIIESFPIFYEPSKPNSYVYLGPCQRSMTEFLWRL